MKKFIVKIRKPKIKGIQGILYFLVALSGMLLWLFSQPALIFAASVDSANYHQSRILVKFVPEVETEVAEEIRSGRQPVRIPNKLKRKFSKGKIWQMEPGAGETVDKLLKKYQTVYRHLIKYVQLDYECSAGSKAQKPVDKLYESYIKDYLKFIKDIQFGSSASGLNAPFSQGASGESLLSNTQLLWYLNDININGAWNVTHGDPSVVIAVLDTGAAYENAPIEENEWYRVSSLSTGYTKAPGLSNLNLWVNSQELPNNNLDDDGDGYVDDVNGFNFIDHDGYPHDDNGHGTFLTNMLASDSGVEENPIGIASQCTFMVLKVLDHSGRGYSSSVSEGIYYAVDHGAKVINLSLAWPPGIDPGPIVRDAIAYAANAGVIMVAGAGNNARNKVCYPAAYDEVIAVGATQLDHTRAWYSNYGPELEIMAPGGNSFLDQNLDGYPDGILQETLDPIYQILLSGEEILANPSIFEYWFLQGTSMSTAITTGVVGLMVSTDPKLDAASIRNILYRTATNLGPVGWDREYGYGLINAGSAIYGVLNGLQYQNPEPLPDPVFIDPLPAPDPVLTDPVPIVPPNPTCPECLTDLEIETECVAVAPGCDEVETECDECLNDEEIEGECPN